MAAKVRRCGRCNRRLRGAAMDWMVELNFDDDELATPGEINCPDCQTDTEAAERQSNDRDYDYVWVDGERISMWPKAVSN